MEPPGPAAPALRTASVLAGAELVLSPMTAPTPKNGAAEPGRRRQHTDALLSTDYVTKHPAFLGSKQNPASRKPAPCTARKPYHWIFTEQPEGGTVIDLTLQRRKLGLREAK